MTLIGILYIIIELYINNIKKKVDRKSILKFIEPIVQKREVSIRIKKSA